MWGFAKVLIGVWASLSILDDVGNLLNIIPLGLALLPGRRRDGLCSLCDAVVADVLLKGSEGIEALPCGMICMRVGECVRMCERIKAISANSTTWPCEAAGYCGSSSDAGPADWMATPQCQKAALGMCRPSRLCERRWRKPIAWNATSSQVIVRAPTACELREGIGRWHAMRDSVRRHAGAVAVAMLDQPRCGEAGAGEWCIASPRGLGAVAEVAGVVLSLVYGGVKTIHAIESPGGHDDRLWLTYWLVFALMSALERSARVLLSWIPIYYEVKLLLLLWMLWFHGSERAYRAARRVLLSALRASGVPVALLVGAGTSEDAVRRELDALPAALRRPLSVDPNSSRSSGRRRSLVSPRAGTPRGPSPTLSPLIEAPADGEAVVAPHREETPRGEGSAPARRGSTWGVAPLLSGARSFMVRGDSVSGASAALRGARSLLRGESLFLEGAIAESSSPSRLTRGHVYQGAARAELVDAYRRMLTPAGLEELHAAGFSESRRRLLLERAMVAITFTPRYLHLHLLDAVLPHWRQADAYCRFFLLTSPAEPSTEVKLGAAFAGASSAHNAAADTAAAIAASPRHPPGGVSSRVAYRASHPTWYQSFELTLQGGSLIDASGYAEDSDDGESAHLLVEVWDAQAGRWGWLLLAIRLAALAAAAATCTAASAYALSASYAAWARSALALRSDGASGTWLPRLGVGHVALAVASAVAAWFARRRLRRGAVLVATSEPTSLRSLSDQAVHEMIVPLRPVAVGVQCLRTSGAAGPGARRGSAASGARGAHVRIACSFSE